MINYFDNKPYLKLLVKAFIFTIQFASLYYLWSSVQVYNDSFINNNIQYSSVWYFLIIVIFLYAIALVFPALGWTRIINYYSKDSVKSSDILWLYWRTSIAKYIPGNVFHYISRQIHGGAFGLKQKVMGIASFIEVLFVVSAGVLISLLFYPFVELPKNFIIIPNALFSLLVIGAIALPWVFIVWINKFIQLKNNGIPLRSVYDAGLLLGYLNYIVFLVFSAILFAGLLFLSGLSFFDSMYGIFIYGFAYVISYITPGAPGGIGVREALLVLFLDGMIPSGKAVSIVIIFRVLTICGELLCFGLTYYFLPERIKLERKI